MQTIQFHYWDDLTNLAMRMKSIPIILSAISPASCGLSQILTPPQTNNEK